jgi:hypothetical protein
LREALRANVCGERVRFDHCSEAYRRQAFERPTEAFLVVDQVLYQVVRVRRDRLGSFGPFVSERVSKWSMTVETDTPRSIKTAATPRMAIVGVRHRLCHGSSPNLPL